MRLNADTVNPLRLSLESGAILIKADSPWVPPVAISRPTGYQGKGASTPFSQLRPGRQRIPSGGEQGLVLTDEELRLAPDLWKYPIRAWLTRICRS